jgi:formylglycine-generating enzyme required for sulfatase activity
MAPETWNSQNSMHSDQYSLAATYVEMRLGRRLYAATTLYELGHLHTHATPDLAPLDGAEKDVLMRALAKDPRRRFPNCAAFVKALREAVQPPPPKPKPGGVSPRAVLLCVAAVLALAALAAWWFWPRRPPVDWVPQGWSPVAGADGKPEVKEDRNGKRFYTRLSRDVGGQPVVLVLVPQTRPSDPPTFYIMENKVWNDLYEALLQDDGLQARLARDRKSNDLGGLFSQDTDLWRKGAGRSDLTPVGIKGRGRVPVFRVTAQEAAYAAEVLGGRLPTYLQWLKAAGEGEDTRPGPFDGDPRNLQGLALAQDAGAWPVTQGKRDVGIWGCREMISNGKEWTRTPAQAGQSELPYTSFAFDQQVRVVGGSYLDEWARTFDDLREKRESAPASLRVLPPAIPPPDISFRIVVEQP